MEWLLWYRGFRLKREKLAKRHPTPARNQEYGVANSQYGVSDRGYERVGVPTYLLNQIHDYGLANRQYGVAGCRCGVVGWRYGVSNRQHHISDQRWECAEVPGLLKLTIRRAKSKIEVGWSARLAGFNNTALQLDNRMCQSTIGVCRSALWTKLIATIPRFLPTMKQSQNFQYKIRNIPNLEPFSNSSSHNLDPRKQATHPRGFPVHQPL